MPATSAGMTAERGAQTVARIERKRNPGMPCQYGKAVPGFRLPLNPGYKLEGKGPPEPLRPQRPAHALRRERKLVQAHARQRRDGVADRARHHRHAVFPGAGRRVVG
jgi:hypothetical protein